MITLIGWLRNVEKRAELTDEDNREQEEVFNNLASETEEGLKSLSDEQLSYLMTDLFCILRHRDVMRTHALIAKFHEVSTKSMLKLVLERVLGDDG